MPPSVQTTLRHSWMAPGAASGDLLYIADQGYGSVLVYSYNPQAITFVGVLSVPANPGSMCVDKEQNVWILGEKDGDSFAATEYAHGGSAPTSVLMDPAGVPTGCGINPTTGDLALSSVPPHGGLATIAVYHNEGGKPKLYTDATVPGFYTCCAYDHKGNLYAYGTETSRGVNVISELPRGSTSFNHVQLDHEIPWLYGMQWVGKYLTVSDSNLNVTSSIDEYTISPSGIATLARKISLPKVTLLWQYFIDRGRIIAPNAPFGSNAGLVGLYGYPAGRDFRTYTFSQPVAVVVSRAITSSQAKL